MPEISPPREGLLVHQIYMDEEDEEDEGPPPLQDCPDSESDEEDDGGVAWAFRGKMDHDVLTWNDVYFGEDAVGKFFNVKPHFFKNHDGGVNGKHRRQEARALKQLHPDDPKDPYNVIVEYSRPRAVPPGPRLPETQDEEPP